ncbi:translation initiation factor IF-2-like [Meles meles]|uniref:translation initiation factor IF-2-like n=1 Tax=Meles meles TaxID=9662 RepID=UPI001E69D6D1|nr:translation initiation factor IF-2-like [Meles meles]
MDVWVRPISGSSNSCEPPGTALRHRAASLWGTFLEVRLSSPSRDTRPSPAPAVPSPHALGPSSSAAGPRACPRPDSSGLQSARALHEGSSRARTTACPPRPAPPRPSCAPAAWDPSAVRRSSLTLREHAPAAGGEHRRAPVRAGCSGLQGRLQGDPRPASAGDGGTRRGRFSGRRRPLVPSDGLRGRGRDADGESGAAASRDPAVGVASARRRPRVPLPT